MPRTGRPKLPESRNERIVIRVTAQELIKLRKYAESRNLSVSELVRERISDILSV